MILQADAGVAHELLVAVHDLSARVADADHGGQRFGDQAPARFALDHGVFGDAALRDVGNHREGAREAALGIDNGRGADDGPDRVAAGVQEAEIEVLGDALAAAREVGVELGAAFVVGEVSDIERQAAVSRS